MKKLYDNIKNWYVQGGKGTLLKIYRILAIIDSIIFIILSIILFFIGLFLYRSVGLAIVFLLLSILLSVIFLISAALFHGEEELFNILKKIEKEKNKNTINNKDNDALDAKIQLLNKKIDEYSSTDINKESESKE